MKVVRAEEAEAIAKQLVSIISHQDDANYLAKRRRTDTVNALLSSLKIGLLVARGYPAVRRKGTWVKAEKMKQVPEVFWAITIEGTDAINFDTGVAVSVLGVYYDLEIGRDEDHKRMKEQQQQRQLVSHPN